MPKAVKNPATYADLEAVPTNLVAELLFGALETHPRPSPAHAMATLALGGELAGPFQKGVDGPGGWIFASEPELHLGPHVVVPDIAGWRRERLPVLPHSAWFDTAPDWVCQVLSPSTERSDKGPKRRIYALYGVGHLWYLDPRARSLEIFARHDLGWLLTHTYLDTEAVNAPPFEAPTFSLGLLWPLDRQAEPDA